MLEKNMAERQGFEPWVALGDNGFRDRRFRPLSHLSNHSVHTGPRFSSDANNLLVEIQL